MRSHGWTRHLPRENRFTSTKSDNPSEESSNFLLPGYTFWPPEMSGAHGQEQLKKLGFECRPIMAGNFTKNPAMTHIPHVIHGALPNAEYIDENVLFIGNHNDPIPEVVEVLAQMRM